MNTVVKLFRGQNHSKDTFTRLLRPHVDLMYRMAYRWTNDQQNAEDLVQDVLVKLASRVDDLQGIDQLRPWLIKVLYRQFVDQYRRRGRQLEVVETELQGASNPSQEKECSALDYASSPDSSRQISQRQDLALALKQLDSEQRDVILLHDAEGYTDSETAEILGISKGTVKSRLHRGRNKIKKFLSGEPFLEYQRVRK